MKGQLTKDDCSTGPSLYSRHGGTNEQTLTDFEDFVLAFLLPEASNFNEDCGSLVLLSFLLGARLPEGIFEIRILQPESLKEFVVIVESHQIFFRDAY
jgi:hypothetical protein